MHAIRQEFTLVDIVIASFILWKMIEFV